LNKRTKCCVSKGSHWLTPQNMPPLYPEDHTPCIGLYCSRKSQSTTRREATLITKKLCPSNLQTRRCQEVLLGTSRSNGSERGSLGGKCKGPKKGKVRVVIQRLWGWVRAEQGQQVQIHEGQVQRLIEPYGARPAMA